MDCTQYIEDIELIDFWEKENQAKFAEVMAHLQECCACQKYFAYSRTFDELLAAKLQAIPVPEYVPGRIQASLQEIKINRLRQAVLRLVKGTTSHPNAKWIYEELKPQFPKITLSTIYRHLRVLKRRGQLIELDFGEGFKRFDGNLDRHDHFICKSCNTIYDIWLDKEELSAYRLLPHLVLNHRLELYGICRNCTVKTGYQNQ